MRYPASIFLIAVLAAPGAAQDPSLPSEADYAAALALAGPGEEHVRLTGLAGSWDLEIVLATSPTATTMIRGVSENRMVLGGRFLVSEAKSLEPVMGMDIEAMSIYGFDRRDATFTVLGLDTFGTYHVEARGGPTDSQTIVMPGVMVDPQTKRQERYDMILRFIDDDTYVTAVVFKLDSGEEAKAVEITHRRRR